MLLRVGRNQATSFNFEAPVLKDSTPQLLQTPIAPHFDWSFGLRNVAGGIMHAIQKHPLVVAAVIIGATGPGLPASAQGGPAARVETRVQARAAERFNVSVSTARGAYYRKVTSDALTTNAGMRAEGFLPTPSFDSARYFVAPEGLDFFRTGPLDRPSIYVGGRGGGREVDAGLVWDRVFDPTGRPTYTDNTSMTDGRDKSHRFYAVNQGGQKVVFDGNDKEIARGDKALELMKKLRPNFAFRPFWRTINGKENKWTQPEVGAANNLYFYPGEKMAMSVRTAGKNEVRLDIRSLEPDVAQHFEMTMRQEGFGVGKKQSFKRVSSIDQFYVTNEGERKGRENQNVLPTKTQSLGMHWTEVTLLDSRPNKSRPFTGRRFTEVRGRDTNANYRQIFKVSTVDAAGGEKVDITPLQR